LLFVTIYVRSFQINDMCRSGPADVKIRQKMRFYDWKGNFTYEEIVRMFHYALCESLCSYLTDSSVALDTQVLTHEVVKEFAGRYEAVALMGPEQARCSEFLGACC